VLDYIDDQIPMLQRMYAKRKNGYDAMGYLIGEDKALLEV
jgi:hypothetical protein